MSDPITLRLYRLFLAAIVAAVIGCGAAHAGCPATVPPYQHGFTFDGSGSGCVVTAPREITGFGTLALSNSSTLFSTATLGPNSAAWPATPGMVTILNETTSAGNVYVCPLGGLCTSANGLVLTPSRTLSVYQPATGMTMIADSSATVQGSW